MIFSTFSSQFLPIKLIIELWLHQNFDRYHNFITLCNSRNNTTSRMPNGTASKSNGAIPQPKNNEQQSDKSSPTTSINLQLEAQMEQRLKEPLDLYYKMDHKNRGLCIIFNHETFVDRGLPYRRGTQVDRDRLIKTFTALDFDVRIDDDPSEGKIRAILEKGERKAYNFNGYLIQTLTFTTMIY